MDLRIKLKPTKIVKNSREGIIDAYSLFGMNFSNYGIYTRETDTEVYVFNIEKIGRKTKQTKNKQGKTVKIEVIRRKHYVGYIYKIPKAVLQAMNLKVEQKRNNFIFVKKK